VSLVLSRTASVFGWKCFRFLLELLPVQIGRRSVLAGAGLHCASDRASTSGHYATSSCCGQHPALRLPVPPFSDPTKLLTVANKTRMRVVAASRPDTCKHVLPLPLRNSSTSVIS